MKWINFLHIYQPANSDAHAIKEATDACYLRVVRALEGNSEIQFTVNINGCLLLRWEELGYGELISRIRELIKKGQIEITGTAAYHPLLPLIPAREVAWQIKENERILDKYFGGLCERRGFYFPEMAYSPATAKIVKNLGYRWTLLDEIAVSGKLDKNNSGRIYLDKNSGLQVVVRSRKLSNTYVPDTIHDYLDKERADGLQRTIVTGTDSEIYGLRHKDQSGKFEKLLKRPGLMTDTITGYIKAGDKPVIAIRPPAHSWETSREELKRNEPFNVWQDPKNLIQRKLWQLARLAYNTMEEYKDDKNYYWVRWHFVRGLASCTFWWASAKDFQLFGPISWNPDEIERGTNELIRSIRALDGEETREAKVRAEKLYIEIKKMVWEKHWTYHWKCNSA